MSDIEGRLEKELRKIPVPIRGIEFPRVPVPPPSEHSSQGWDEEDDQEGNPGGRKKKPPKTVAEYIQIRNETYKAYLKKLEENPPRTYCKQIAQIQRKISGNARLRYTPPQRRPCLDDVSVNYSDTSCESYCSIPRNHGRARESIIKKCEDSIVSQRKQQLLNEESVDGVLFSHVNFQRILEAKWTLIKLSRREQILEGVNLGCTVDLKWLEFEKDIYKYYGPMDTDSEHFKRLFIAFQMQRWEMIIDMFEQESKMMEKMLEEKKVPSDFPEQLAGLRKTRSMIELMIGTMPEMQCDQNPYTNPDGMDFWVLPRPKQTIAVYGIHHPEMEDFLEFQLPVSEEGGEGETKGKGVLEKKKLFVREGYNPAVFDVGWNYAVEKVYGDVPWKKFFIDDYGDFHRGNKRDSEKAWGTHLLLLRGFLMTYNPFGVQDIHYFKHVRYECHVPEDDSMLGNYEDVPSVGYLSDLAYSQKLVSSGGTDGSGKGPETKTILFDSLFQGVIVTPAEMLARVKTRIIFLIEEQPNHLLPIDELQEIYENCFGQKFFPLQWGYEDMEDFLQKEIMDDDVVIVEKEESEVEEVQEDKASKEEIQREIDAKWASILVNDDDEEEDDKCSDLFEELVHEGPWVSEGEVYRVLDD